MLAKRGQVLFIARSATRIILHVEEYQQSFGHCLQTKEVEYPWQRLLNLASKHINHGQEGPTFIKIQSAQVLPQKDQE